MDYPPDRVCDICVENNEIVLSIQTDVYGSNYQSWQWDFEVYLTPSGDLNGDGRIDGADLALLLGAWGSNNPEADLNGDGIVDGEDITELFSMW
jgi:hypothetical protein